MAAKKKGFARESWSKEEGIIDHLSFPRLETLRRKKYFCQFFNSSENVIIILASRLNDVRIFSVRQTVLTTFIILRISRQPSSEDSQWKMEQFLGRCQCDQIGQFLKFLGSKIFSKKSQNYWQLFGLFRKTSLFCKNCIGYFQGNVLKKQNYF